MLVEAARLPHEERQPGPAHGVEDSHCIVQRRRHGLRADDVLACVQRRQHVLDVQRVGREDADEVDIVPRDDLAPVGRREGHIVLCADRFEPILIRVADGGDADRRVGQVVGEEHVRPHAQADDSGVDDGLVEWHVLSSLGITCRRGACSPNRFSSSDSGTPVRSLRAGSVLQTISGPRHTCPTRPTSCTHATLFHRGFSAH